MEFKTIRAAMDYLAKRIVEQAEIEGAPLTEIERKMLYFTEEGGLSPAMAAVSDEFDRDYDQDCYEERIAGLVERLLARPDTTAQRADWDAAATRLCDGDNYLTVLINAKPAPVAGSSWWEILKPWLPTLESRPKTDKSDFLRLILVGVAVSLLLLIGISVLALSR